MIFGAALVGAAAGTAATLVALVLGTGFGVALLIYCTTALATTIGLCAARVLLCNGERRFPLKLPSGSPNQL